MLKATSSAVRSDPSWNFTPWRTLMAMPILPSVHCQLSMMCGPYLPCRSCWRNRSNTASYIDSRGLLRGAGCGSMEVTVSGKAMVTTCFFCAWAGVARAPVARAAAPPVARRNVRRVIRMGLPPVSVIASGFEWGIA